MFAVSCLITPSMAQDKSAPSMAFLEYLAELENVDGKWVDPLDFQLQQMQLRKDCKDKLLESTAVNSKDQQSLEVQEQEQEQEQEVNPCLIPEPNEEEQKQ